jgi:predicted  nucleic acid-binding Zn-ribbon protein
MPHQCTNCGRVFPDGSKEMLSGCPDCGGHKFQFRPSSTVDDDGGDDVDGVGDAAGTDAGAASDDPDRGSPSTSPTPSESQSPSERSQSDESPTAATDRGSTDAGPGASAGKPGPGETPPGSTGGASPGSTDAESGDGGGDREDRAQRDARSEVVGPDELPDHVTREPPDAEGTVIEPDDEERPDIDELRQELNDQFESIRIVSPGTYELNLMELYDRDEYIISLQEDGRYVIEVPDSWRDAGE